MTQKEQILEYLKKHGSITPMDALSEIGCFRLSGRICDLRNEGHEIETVFETKNGKTYARYYLKESESNENDDR